MTEKALGLLAGRDGRTRSGRCLGNRVSNLQVNGYCGDDLNTDDLTIDTIQSLARRMLAPGVTTFLPTLITASEER
jgi:N-acetylglucosamine-6-phosphate deacetylase